MFDIPGSGIFVSPKGVLLRSGSVGMTLVVWAGGGFISLLGALSFAELGTLVTKSGGDYIYILEAFRGCGVVGPVPAFLYAWTTCLLLKPASLGITTQSFAKYMLTPFFLYCEDTPTIPTKMLAIWTISKLTSADPSSTIWRHCFCCYSTSLVFLHNGIMIDFLLPMTVVISAIGDSLAHQHV